MFCNNRTGQLSTPMVDFYGNDHRAFGKKIRKSSEREGGSESSEPGFSPMGRVMPPVSTYDAWDGKPRVYEISVTLGEPLNVVLSRCLMRFPQGKILESGKNNFIFNTGVVGILAQEAVAIIKGVEGVVDAYWLGGGFEPHPVGVGMNEKEAGLPSID